MSGVDSTGFIQKTITEIISDLQSGYRTVYGASVNIASRSRIGQRIALFAGSLSEVWEAVQDVYNSTDPDSATGEALDSLMKLNGLSRKPATSSTVVLTLCGTTSTVINSGKQAKVTETGVIFALNNSVTLAAVSAWTGTHAYSLGQRAKNGGNIYQAITPGTSASSGGPTGTSQVADGSVEWQYIGTGTGSGDGLATATATGALQGFSGTVNAINTPVSGWATVTNLLDAFVGAPIETDPPARARRAQSFSAAAATPLDAIRTAVLAVPGVTTCVIFENYTDVTDSNGVPAKSFETLVEGGVDADVAAAIFSKRPGGIQPYGTTTVSVNDSLGNAHSIGLSRPAAVNIYVAATLLFDVRSYPGNGDVQAQEAIEIRQNANSAGKNVVASGIAAGLFEDIVGVLDVQSVFIDTSPNPVTSTTIVITNRQKATFDTSRITIASSAGDF